jgi:hypothetical protein
VTPAPRANDDRPGGGNTAAATAMSSSTDRGGAL